MITFASHSTPDSWHVVTGEGTPDARCTCMAAMFGQDCWAVARAAEIVQRERELHARASAALREQYRPENVSTGITHPQEKEKMVTTFKARKWDEETDGSGEFAIPDVPDGTYVSTIVDCEDREFTSEFGTSRKYMVKWELDGLATFDDEGEERPVTLIQFVKIPKGLIESGYVHEKSDLYAFLKVVGVNPDAPEFDVDPGEWTGCQGLIWVENKASRKKPDEVRPQVVKVTKLAPKGHARRNTVVRTGAPLDVTTNTAGTPWEELQQGMREFHLMAADLKPYLGGEFSSAALSRYLSTPKALTVGQLLTMIDVNRAAEQQEAQR